MPRFGGLLLTLGAAALIATPTQAQSVKIVVNANNDVSALSRDEIARLFLKKETAFRGGQPAVPVDQGETSAVRQAFSTNVLGKDVRTVLTYWQQMIFSGRGAPPAQRSSDADVLAFVRNNPNAIGYVLAGTDVGPGVRVLSVY